RMGSATSPNVKWPFHTVAAIEISLPACCGQSLERRRGRLAEYHGFAQPRKHTPLVGGNYGNTVSLFRRWWSERKFQIQRSCDGVGGVGLDLAESDGSVECNGFVHLAGDRIQPHRPVTKLAGAGDYPLRQPPAQLQSAKSRAHVQPLHLANAPP